MTASANSPNGAYSRPEAPGRPSHKHGYIYGSGSRGCLYDNGPHWSDTRQGAVDSLCWAFRGAITPDLMSRLRRQLIEHGFADLPPGAGADYAEIDEATAEQAAQFQESDE